MYTDREMKKRHQERREDELLEIFILIEEDTISSKVEAVRRYKNLYSLNDVTLAVKKMKEAYSNFQNNK